MDTARIATLLAPFIDRQLSESQLNAISTYIDLLLRWNARINLTAIRKGEEIVTRHFGESFFMASHLFPVLKDCHPERSSNIRLVDIGSGAGFPAIPLKLWAPEIHLTLIESNHKKAAFLREVSRALSLTNVDVLTDRAETIAANPNFPRASVVTIRAVERFQTILPEALLLLAPQSRLALLISTAQVSQLPTENLEWQPAILVPQSQSRVLLVGSHT